MNLRISGKQMEIGDAFRSRIEDRIGEAIDKYFDGGFSGHVTVEKSGSRYAADCMIRLDSVISLQATGEAQEPQSAFDVAAEKFEKRLRRYKRKLRSHHANGGASESPVDIAYRVMAPLDEDEDRRREAEDEEVRVPRVHRVGRCRRDRGEAGGYPWVDHSKTMNDRSHLLTEQRLPDATRDQSRRAAARED